MASNRIVFIKDTACDKSQAIEAFQNAFVAKLKEKNLDEVQVVRVADAGIYDKGIVAKVFPENIVYTNLTELTSPISLTRQLQTVQKLAALLRKAFFTKRIVLRNCGVINPESLEEYVAKDGYLALKKALSTTPLKAQ